jgi:predicted dehydrogenase
VKTKIAFISTAHIHAKDFIKNIIEASDGREIAVVWDSVEDRGRRYAELASAPFEPDLEKVLRNPEADGFIICAENTRHLSLLEKVLPVGKPVFCEKPLVTSTEDLAKVEALLEKYPTTLFCGYFLPFSSVMAGVKTLIDQGAFGKITRMRYRNAHHAAYGRWFDSPDLAWFTDPALAGGGAFMDMGTHAIHLARSLFGPVTEVVATIGNQSGHYPEVDDYGIAQLRFASGVIGTIEGGWTQTGGIGGLEIVGSERALWDTGSQYVYGAPGKPVEDVVPGADAPSRVDRLVAVLKGEVSQESLRADIEAIKDTVAIMDACYRSSQSGRWENLDSR